MKVRLVISGVDVSPETISEVLQLTPNKIWLKGEVVHPKATNVHTENGWVLSVESSDRELSAEKMLDKLIAIIPAGRLVTLRDRYKDRLSVELSIIVQLSVSGAAPSVSLSQDQVTFLARCGGSLDVDLYPA
jgi:hypothetical protein